MSHYVNPRFSLLGNTSFRDQLGDDFDYYRFKKQAAAFGAAIVVTAAVSFFILRKIRFKLNRVRSFVAVYMLRSKMCAPFLGWMYVALIASVIASIPLVIAAWGATSAITLSSVLPGMAIVFLGLACYLFLFGALLYIYTRFHLTNTVVVMISMSVLGYLCYEVTLIDQIDYSFYGVSVVFLGYNALFYMICLYINDRHKRTRFKQYVEEFLDRQLDMEEDKTVLLVRDPTDPSHHSTSCLLKAVRHVAHMIRSRGAMAAYLLSVLILIIYAVVIATRASNHKKLGYGTAMGVLVCDGLLYVFRRVRASIGPVRISTKVSSVVVGLFFRFCLIVGGSDYWFMGHILLFTLFGSWIMVLTVADFVQISTAEQQFKLYLRDRIAADDRHRTYNVRHSPGTTHLNQVMPTISVPRSPTLSTAMGAPTAPQSPSPTSRRLERVHRSIHFGLQRMMSQVTVTLREASLVHPWKLLVLLTMLFAIVHVSVALSDLSDVWLLDESHQQWEIGFLSYLLILSVGSVTWCYRTLIRVNFMDDLTTSEMFRERAFWLSVLAYVISGGLFGICFVFVDSYLLLLSGIFLPMVAHLTFLIYRQWINQDYALFDSPNPRGDKRPDGGTPTPTSSTGGDSRIDLSTIASKAAAIANKTAPRRQWTSHYMCCCCGPQRRLVWRFFGAQGSHRDAKMLMSMIFVIALLLAYAVAVSRLVTPSYIGWTVAFVLALIGSSLIPIIKFYRTLEVSRAVIIGFGVSAALEIGYGVGMFVHVLDAKAVDQAFWLLFGLLLHPSIVLIVIAFLLWRDGVHFIRYSVWKQRREDARQRKGSADEDDLDVVGDNGGDDLRLSRSFRSASASQRQRSLSLSLSVAAAAGADGTGKPPRFVMELRPWTMSWLSLSFLAVGYAILGGLFIASMVFYSVVVGGIGLFLATSGACGTYLTLIWVRNDFHIPRRYRYVYLSAAVVVIAVGAAIAAIENHFFLGVSTVWSIAFLGMASRAFVFVRKMRNVYYRTSPDHVFPIFKMDPTTNSVVSANRGMLAVYWSLVLLIGWGTLATVFLDRPFYGSSISVMAIVSATLISLEITTRPRELFNEVREHVDRRMLEQSVVQAARQSLENAPTSSDGADDDEFPDRDGFMDAVMELERLTTAAPSTLSGDDMQRKKVLVKQLLDHEFNSRIRMRKQRAEWLTGSWDRDSHTRVLELDVLIRRSYTRQHRLIAHAHLNVVILADAVLREYETRFHRFVQNQLADFERQRRELSTPEDEEPDAETLQLQQRLDRSIGMYRSVLHSRHLRDGVADVVRGDIDAIHADFVAFDRRVRQRAEQARRNRERDMNGALSRQDIAIGAIEDDGGDVNVAEMMSDGLEDVDAVAHEEDAAMLAMLGAAAACAETRPEIVAQSEQLSRSEMEKLFSDRWHEIEACWRECAPASTTFVRSTLAAVARIRNEIPGAVRQLGDVCEQETRAASLLSTELEKVRSESYAILDDFAANVALLQSGSAADIVAQIDTQRSELTTGFAGLTHERNATRSAAENAATMHRSKAAETGELAQRAVDDGMALRQRMKDVWHRALVALRNAKQRNSGVGEDEIASAESLLALDDAVVAIASELSDVYNRVRALVSQRNDAETQWTSAYHQLSAFLAQHSDRLAAETSVLSRCEALRESTAEFVQHSEERLTAVRQGASSASRGSGRRSAWERMRAAVEWGRTEAQRRLAERDRRVRGLVASIQTAVAQTRPRPADDRRLNDDMMKHSVKLQRRLRDLCRSKERFEDRTFIEWNDDVDRWTSLTQPRPPPEPLPSSETADAPMSQAEAVLQRWQNDIGGVEASVFAPLDSHERQFIGFANRVRQGTLGDCWFLSALSVVASNPEMLSNLFVVPAWMNPRGERIADLTKRRLFKQCLECGLFGVRFYVDGRWVMVYVDDQVPSDARGLPAYGASKKRGDIWVSLVEKAYAKLWGNYRKLEGGMVPSGLVDMTGGVALSVDMTSTEVRSEIQSGSLWEKLLAWKNAKYLMGAGSPAGSDSDVNEFGIVQGHAYAILQVVEADGHRLLQLRNPWGETEWNGDFGDDSEKWTPRLKRLVKFARRNDGAFWIEFKDFVLQYEDLYLCRPIPSSTWQISEHAGFAQAVPKKSVDYAHLPQLLISVLSDRATLLIVMNQSPASEADRLAYERQYMAISVFDAGGEHISRVKGVKRIGPNPSYKNSKEISLEVSLDRLETPYSIVGGVYKPAMPGRLFMRVYCLEGTVDYGGLSSPHTVNDAGD